MKKHLLLVPLLAMFCGQAFAVCSLTSTLQDPEYILHDAHFDWAAPYTLTATNTPSGALITFTWQDNLEGVECMLFDVTNNQFHEYHMAVSGNTATYTVSGYFPGTGISVIVKVMCSKGQAFTARFGYILGDDCDLTGWCTGSSKEVDQFYTSNDPNHALATMQEGYHWQLRTISGGAEVRMTFDENLLGLESPQFFDLTDPTTMTEHPMQWAGKTASYVLGGYPEGTTVIFLVKIAFTDGGVIFTKRISYTIGETCNEAAVVVPMEDEQTLITFENGILHTTAADLTVYDITGRLVSTTNDCALTPGLYLVHSGNRTTKLQVQ